MLTQYVEVNWAEQTESMKSKPNLTEDGKTNPNKVKEILRELVE
ncbi:MAG: hypothetical protein ACTS7D_01010 [Candidatus Hodgkinia cicadicola]